MKAKYLVFALIISACGTRDIERVSYLEGRISFRAASSLSAPTVIEYSSDHFASVIGRESVSNDQGLLTFPFRLNVSRGGDFIQVRAYQDLNSNSAWDAGEPSGRFDRTDDGNADHLTINRIVDVQDCTKADGTAGPCGLDLFDGEGRNTYKNVDIVIDSTGGA